MTSKYNLITSLLQEAGEIDRENENAILKGRKARVFYGSFKSNAEIAWNNGINVKKFLVSRILKATDLPPSTMLTNLKGVIQEGFPEIQQTLKYHDLPEYLSAVINRNPFFCVPYLLSKDTPDYYDVVDYKQCGLVQSPDGTLFYAEKLFKSTPTTPAAHTFAFFIHVLQTGGDETLVGAIDPSMIYDYLFDPNSILVKYLQKTNFDPIRLVQLLNRLGGTLATKTTLSRFNSLDQLKDIRVTKNNLYPFNSFFVTNKLTLYSKGDLRHCTDSGYNTSEPFIESKQILSELMQLYSTFIPLAVVTFLATDANLTLNDVVTRLIFVSSTRPPGITDWLLSQQIKTPTYKLTYNFDEESGYSILACWNALVKKIKEGIDERFTTTGELPPFSGYNAEKATLYYFTSTPDIQLWSLKKKNKQLPVDESDTILGKLILDYIKQIDSLSKLERTFKDVENLTVMPEITNAVITALRSHPPKSAYKRTGDVISDIVEFFEPRNFPVELIKNISRKKFDVSNPAESFTKTIKNSDISDTGVTFLDGIMYYVTDGGVNVKTRNDTGNFPLSETAQLAVDSWLNNKTSKSVDKRLLEKSFTALQKLAPFMNNPQSFGDNLRDKAINRWIKNQQNTKLHVLFSGSQIETDGQDLTGFVKGDDILNALLKSQRVTADDIDTFELPGGKFLYNINKRSSAYSVVPIAAEYDNEEKNVEWWRTFIACMTWESNGAMLSCERIPDESAPLAYVIIQHEKNKKITTKGRNEWRAIFGDNFIVNHKIKTPDSKGLGGIITAVNYVFKKEQINLYKTKINTLSLDRGFIVAT